MELNSIRVVQGAALPQAGSAEAAALESLGQARETRVFQQALSPGAGVLEPRAVRTTRRAEPGEASSSRPESDDGGFGREGRVVEVGGLLLSFRIEGEGGRPVAELLDPSTRQVVREIPSEELRELAQALADYSGNFIDREG